MAQAYLPNTLPLQPLALDTAALLRQSLEDIVLENPPLDKYEETLNGLAAGPTALAYLFLQMAQKHADLQIQGHGCMYWAEKYISGDRGPQEIRDKNCGLVCEKLAFAAVKASITQADRDMAAFLDNVPRLLASTPEGAENPFPSEMLYGRAALLYMLRMVKSKGDWLWNGKRYYGAPHGDMGIIRQIVLSDPSLAPKLTARLEELLDLQTETGNWPDTDEQREDADRRVQFCHGAPGFIFALQSLRPFYPEFQQSALPRGERREHFVSLAMPDSLANLRTQHPGLFLDGSYGFSSSPLLSYSPSAAWTWSVLNDAEPRIILFNDI
ncbi:LanC-like protein 1 [Metarhizium rileyi]|uniref:LanC-like protein 1 n=1 Tax=Metarhizium rileyi (strain RCEF 4871) TaxID=1649241 RepID=A0A162JSP9_METRR|nr:LanC-like protein 1 [Metarhizium rileyi RCEF 4871]